MLLPKSFDPLSDPLQVENLCNEALHALRTGGPHVICEVTIDVQGERRRGMAEIALHGFDVISCPDAVHGVGMPQIMDSGSGDPNLIDHAFEAVIESPVGHIAAKFVGEHQSGVLPCGTSHQFLLRLMNFLRPE